MLHCDGYEARKSYVDLPLHVLSMDKSISYPLIVLPFLSTVGLIAIAVFPGGRAFRSDKDVYKNWIDKIHSVSAIVSIILMICYNCFACYLINQFNLLVVYGVDISIHYFSNAFGVLALVLFAIGSFRTSTLEITKENWRQVDRNARALYALEMVSFYTIMISNTSLAIQLSPNSSSFNTTFIFIVACFFDFTPLMVIIIAGLIFGSCVCAKVHKEKISIDYLEKDSYGSIVSMGDPINS